MDEPRTFLAEFLEGHDAPCPVCSYNLRGVALPHCPECRSPITLTVGSEQARMGPWLLAALAFGMGIGFDSVVALLLSIPLIATGGEAGAAVMFCVMVLLAVASGFGLRVLLGARRSFQSRPVPAQWRRAWLIFAGVFFFHLACGATLVLTLAF